MAVEGKVVTSTDSTISVCCTPPATRSARPIKKLSPALPIVASRSPPPPSRQLYASRPIRTRRVPRPTGRGPARNRPPHNIGAPRGRPALHASGPAAAGSGVASWRRVTGAARLTRSTQRPRDTWHTASPPFHVLCRSQIRQRSSSGRHRSCRARMILQKLPVRSRSDTLSSPNQRARMGNGDGVTPFPTRMGYPHSHSPSVPQPGTKTGRSYLKWVVSNPIREHRDGVVHTTM